MNEQTLMVDVLRVAGRSDCTNGGVSVRYDRALLVGEGVRGPWSTNDHPRDVPILRLVKRWAGTPNEYLHAEPEPEWRATGLGPMMGGNFVYSSDSRFRAVCAYPIPVHDRWEKQR